MMKRIIASLLATLLLLSMYLSSLPLVSADYTVENPYMPPYLAGDVNNDGIVFWQDLVAMFLAYGSEEGDANWDPRCDFNQDGQVFWQDLLPVLINYGNAEEPPIVYSNSFEFTVPNDGDEMVWYYLLMRVYVPPELADENFYLTGECDDGIRNVKIDNELIFPGLVRGLLNIPLDQPEGGFHLFELEYGESIGAGLLNFSVTASTGEYAWLTRFRVYVPYYTDTEYRYTIRTHTYFDFSDDYFLQDFPTITLTT